jgi:hypothetical protein
MNSKDLEQLQIALFAAYDIRNAMNTEDREQPTENDTFGESIDLIIESLVELEQRLTA